jgi:radical SAM superfamily enzyme YgiQ (UPF0313 family)
VRKPVVSAGKACDVLFVNPLHPYNHYFTQPELVRIMRKKNILAPLALPLLAALTPDTFSVSIWDEDIAPLDPYNVSAKLVAIKLVTTTSQRSYKLADVLRSCGAKIVFGGPHLGLGTKNEALAHADAVVVGEAEAVWPGLLDDFRRGTLQKLYSSTDLVPFTKSATPRWDLLDTDAYLSLPVQASRGCPYNCEFCNVSANFGRKVRIREVDNVLHEVASLPLKRVFFVDDNLTINRKFARDLMTGLQGMGISWFCQASIDIADDPALLSAMASAGCENILMGFESLNKMNLQEIDKLHNLKKDFKEAINTIHAAGIHVQASFIVGFDNDTLEDFERLYQFSVAAPLPFTALSILGAPPNTRLKQRLESEGRLYAIPPEIDGGLHPSIKHPTMPPLLLYDAFIDTIQKLYRFDTIFQKASTLFATGYFAKIKKDKDVPLSEKIRLGTLLVRVFLFSRDKWRRKLFVYFFSLIRKKTVAPERAVIFLLTMHAFSLSVDKMASERERRLEIIRSYTKCQS